MSLNNFIIKTGKSLDSDLRAIGFNLSGKKKSIDPNIEFVIISASIEAVNNKDNRIGGLLVDWITVHYLRINVDRLTKFISSLSDKEYKFVKIFWCANAQRLFVKDQRFKRLSKLYNGRRVNFADRFIKKEQQKVTKMLIEIKGEDERFKKTCIRVSKGYFSERPQQIFPVSIIAKNHLPYRYRVMMGPSYRADLWALLDSHPNISAYALGKKAHCSYRSAYIAKKDYELLKGRKFTLKNS
ncbi:MAG: hypothetical protein OXK80_00820 [Bdellovibrionales bacterium]|nr:hypothetical protein [Bdellovibrionales bacterium]